MARNWVPQYFFRVNAIKIWDSFQSVVPQVLVPHPRGQQVFRLGKRWQNAVVLGKIYRKTHGS